MQPVDSLYAQSVYFNYNDGNTENDITLKSKCLSNTDQWPIVLDRPIDLKPAQDIQFYPLF